MPTIDEIKARLLAKSNAEAKAKAERDAREAEENTRRSTAAEQWLVGAQTAQLVINQLDSELSGSGLSISYSRVSKPEAALDAFSVALSGATKARLHVNINAFGRATSRMEIPQVSKPGPSFDVSEFSAEQFREYLLAFIGEAISR